MHLLQLLDKQLNVKAVGTLTLGRKECFRELFVEQDQVYLVGNAFSGRIAVDQLTRLGIPGARLPVEKMEGLIHSSDLKTHLLAEVLFETGIINNEEFRLVVEEQLLEEIIDLLLQNPGSFQFEENRVPEYLLQYEHIAGRVPLKLSQVLAEIRRRESLLQTHASVVPSREEIFVVTEKGLALQQAPSPDFALQTVLKLVDGLRTMQVIIDGSWLYEFHACACMVRALEQGLIKKTVHPELRGVATQSLTPADVEKYLPLFKNAVRFAVDELAARERLAALYEKAGKVDDAVIQYNFIGDALCRMRKPAKAVKAYHRALDLRPEEILVTEKITKIYLDAAQEEQSNGTIAQAVLFLEEALKLRPEDLDTLTRLLDLLVAQKDLREASALCDWICSGAKRSRSPDAAIQACRQIIRAFPGASALRKKLINLYLDFGLNADACEEMGQLAGEYIARGQTDKVEEVVEKLRRIGGSTAARQIERRLALHARNTAGPPTRARRGRTSSWALVAMALLFGYQALGFFYWSHIDDLGSSPVAAAGGSGDATSIRPGGEELACREIASQCERFQRSFPFHLLYGEARRLGEKAGSRAAALRQKRDREVTRLMGLAHEAVNEGEAEGARETLAQLQDLDSQDPRHAEVSRLRARCEGLSVSAIELQEIATRLETKARVSRLEDDWRSVYAAYRKLATAFPESRLVKDLRLPLWIESLPTGAEVREIVSAGNEKPLGVTPFLLPLRPGETRDLSFVASGCARLDTRITADDEANSTILLPRLAEGEIEVPGTVEHRPACDHGLVVFGTTEGRLYAIDAAAHRVVWTWEVPGGNVHRILYPPLVTEHGVLTAWSNGEVRRVPLKGPRPATQTDPAPQRDALILGGLPTTELCVLPGSSLLCIGTTTGALEIHDARTLEPRGTVFLQGVASSLSDLGDGEVLVGTQQGGLLSAGTRTLECRRLTRDTGDAVVEAYRLGNWIAASTKSKRIRFYSVRQDMKLAELPVPPHAGLRILPERGRLCLLDEQGVLHSITPDGVEPLSRDLRLSAATLLPMPGRLGVLHDQSSALVLVDPHTLRPFWSTRVEGDARITAVGVGSTDVGIAVAPAEDPDVDAKAGAMSRRGGDARTRFRVYSLTYPGSPESASR